MEPTAMAEPRQMADQRRLTLPLLGEWYLDVLTADAAINARLPGPQAQSLLCAKLQEREPRVKERVEYLARKRGLSFEQMWKDLITGHYEPITPEEWAALPPDQDDDEGSDRP